MSISSIKSCYRKEIKYAPIVFTLVGFVSCPEFQEAMTIIELLHAKLPREFPAPLIRPMLEFDWIEFLIKAQRRHGGSLWHLPKPFIIYMNGRQLGCHGELEAFLSSRYYIRINRDYQHLAHIGLLEMYDKFMEVGRKFVFFTVNVNNCCVGNLIFMLYHDLVPKTCEKFIKKCIKHKHGYRGVKVHRIVKNSWIQCAGFVLRLKSMPNENYIVPHNRRGILSMCSNGLHTDNTTQFFITLDSTPWMDYKYVAFGKLMQGECVLHHLETQAVKGESPLNEIFISNCGEITVEDIVNMRNMDDIYQYLEERGSALSLNYAQSKDIPSILFAQTYQQNLYCYPTDAESYLPLNNLPSSMVLPSMPELVDEESGGDEKKQEGEDEGEGEEEEVPDVESGLTTPFAYMGEEHDVEEHIETPEYSEMPNDTDVAQNMPFSTADMQSQFDAGYEVDEAVHAPPKKHIQFLDADVPPDTTTIKKHMPRKKTKSKGVIVPTDEEDQTDST